MSETVDVVVAGAGHNSLITACYLAQAGFDVLVLDADLPDLDGVEVARALHRERFSTRVVLYTMETEIERYSGRWNIAACVPKDAPPSDLIDAIRESVRANLRTGQPDGGQSA